MNYQSILKLFFQLLESKSDLHMAIYVDYSHYSKNLQKYTLDIMKKNHINTQHIKTTQNFNQLFFHNTTTDSFLLIQKADFTSRGQKFNMVAYDNDINQAILKLILVPQAIIGNTPIYFQMEEF
jgi:hypothetical protein